MRPRSLLVLFALVAGLGGFIWFFERELPSTDERFEQTKMLVRLDTDSVRVILLTAGEQRSRLERTAPSSDASDAGDASGASGEWVLTEPRTGRADADEVRAFLERVQELEKERTLTDVSGGQLGLDSPRAEVKIETESEDIVLRFGSEIPASSNTIVEVGSGPPFHVVADSLFEDIARDPNDWRSRDAIPIERFRIDRIEILNPPSGVTLERTEDGFRLVEPIEDPADDERVSSLLTALVELEIEEFVDTPSSDFDTTPSAVRLTIANVAEPVLVEIASSEAAEGLVAVRVDGQVFKAETDLASLLEFLPAEWQSTSWSDRDVSEIEAFRIVRSGNESGFERREGKWLRGDVEIEYSNASAFLYAITGAKGVPVGSVPSHSGETPELEIDLESSGETQVLRLWADGDGYLGERKGRAALIQLAQESAEDLFAKLEALESAPASVPD